MGKDKSAFDKSAKTWDSDAGRTQTARDVARAIRKRIKTDKSLQALDFGCGTGLVSLELLDALKSLTAIDTSTEMLNIFRQKIKESGIKNVRIRQTDWQDEAFEKQQFDLIFSSMTLHHIHDQHALLAKFFSMLKPGGSLCIADLFPEDGDFHSDKHIVAHFGFDPQILKDDLMNLGFDFAGYEKIHIIRKTVSNGKQKDFPLFLLTSGKR